MLKLQDFWNVLDASLLWSESQIAGLLAQTQVCTKPRWYARNSNDLGLTSPFCTGVYCTWCLLNASSVLQSWGGHQIKTTDSFLYFFWILGVAQAWDPLGFFALLNQIGIVTSRMGLLPLKHFIVNTFIGYIGSWCILCMAGLLSHLLAKPAIFPA